MAVKIIASKITQEDLAEIAKEVFFDVAKGAIDVERQVLALGGEFHSDCQEALIEQGSKGTDVWGFNIVMGLPKEKRLELISLINIKPQSSHRSMEIQDAALRQKITEIINNLVE